MLAAALAAAGARTLFNLSGNQIMPLYSPLVDLGVALPHARHEAAAVHMADAHARLTEQPCPVLLTAGPGHANALSALYVARLAESPVVLLSGHSELANAGHGAFQEMDQIGLARRVAKAAWLARDPARLGLDLAKAYHVAASGRPGPVHISLPADVLHAAVPGASGSGGLAASAGVPRALAPATSASGVSDAGAQLGGATVSAATRPPDVTSARRGGRRLAAAAATLVEAIGRARRPLLLTGPAMARGRRWRAVAELADRLRVPALPMESPRGPNDPALGGVRTVFPRADLVVLLGRRLDFSLGFGRPPLFASDAGFVIVDADGPPRRPDLPIAYTATADPFAVVEAALRLGQLVAGDEAWRDDVAAAARLGRDRWPALARAAERPMHPLRLVAAAADLLRDGDVFVGDGGEFGQWAQAGVAASAAQVDRVINGPSGAIGGAFPFAIGASVARPDAQVVAFLGDGTVGFHLAEIETAVRIGARFIAVVGNDEVWNAEVQIQRGLGGAPLACLRIGARYDRVAAALGAHGERVDDPAELAAALARCQAAGRPALLDAAIRGEPAPTYNP